MKTIKLTQQAYICDNGTEYTASAVDENGDTFNVYWEILYPEAELEEDACNWQCPDRVVKDGVEIENYKLN